MAKTSKVQLPTLDTGPLPLAYFREQARRSLLDIIDARRGGRKALLLDPALSSPLSCIDPRLTELLAEHGISRVHYLDHRLLDDLTLNTPGTDNRLLDMRTIMWLVRPTVINTQRIAQQIKNLRNRSGGAYDLCVCFVPRRTIACNRVLEEEGVLGDVMTCEWGGVEVVPLEDDLLSLELEAGFKECVLEGDSSSLYYMARAIMRLQATWGLIPRLQGKGPAAVAVRDMVLRMRRENPGMCPASEGGAGPFISRAVLLDREVDLLTPCMTQITFEGLIDEVTGIKGGAVPWTPKDKRAEATIGGTSDMGAVQGGGSGSSTLLNSTDPFYKEFRNLPYHVAITRLQAAAREARREYEVLGSKDLSQLKSFVKGLPKLLLLDRLTDVASPVAEQVRQQLFHDRLKHELDCVEGVEQEACLSFIQELIFRGAQLVDVLRLMVLCSVTWGGLPRKHFDALREELLVAHGHEHAHTLGALERSGLLQLASSGRSPFHMVRKLLKLVVPEADGATPETPPTDISHIYKGYAPLSIRLVETALSPNAWGKPGSGLYDSLALLPGATWDIAQTHGDLDATPSHTQHTGAKQPSASAGSGRPAGAKEVPASAALQPQDVVLVVFIGGVTYSEISALRWLSSRPGGAQFLILTTQVLNGRTLVSSFIDPTVSAATSSRGALATQAGNRHSTVR